MTKPKETPKQPTKVKLVKSKPVVVEKLKVSNRSKASEQQPIQVFAGVHDWPPMRTSFEKMLEETHEPVNLPLSNNNEGDESPRSAFKRARDKSLRQLSDRISGAHSRKS